jgi:hypothetical protein
MGFDQAGLQLVFNLVVITGAASLAGFCYVLSRANKQLISVLNHQPILGRSFADDDGGPLALAARRSPGWVVVSDCAELR